MTPEAEENEMRHNLALAGVENAGNAAIGSQQNTLVVLSVEIC